MTEHWRRMVAPHFTYQPVQSSIKLRSPSFSSQREQRSLVQRRGRGELSRRVVAQNRVPQTSCKKNRVTWMPMPMDSSLRSLKTRTFFNIKHLDGPTINPTVAEWVSSGEYTRVFKFFGVRKVFPSHVYSYFQPRIFKTEMVKNAMGEGLLYFC